MRRQRIERGISRMLLNSVYLCGRLVDRTGGRSAQSMAPCILLLPSCHCKKTDRPFLSQQKATDWVPQFLRYIKDTWADPAGNLPIAVTEFGFAEPYEAQKTLLQDILYDPIRMSYYHDYMEAILISISEGINVIGDPLCAL